MTDDEFFRAFEACEITNESFHHRDHVRLAWIYLHRFGAEDGAARIAAAIRTFAAHHGKTGKYHHTATIAWMRLISHAAASLPAAAGFEETLRAFPALLDKNYLRGFYSDSLFNSRLAKETFLPPDLKPLFE